MSQIQITIAMLALLVGTVIIIEYAKNQVQKEDPSESQTEEINFDDTTIRPYTSPRIAATVSRHERKQEALASAEDLVQIANPWVDEESLSARGRVSEAMRAARRAEQRRVAAEQARAQAQAQAQAQSAPSSTASAPATSGGTGEVRTVSSTAYCLTGTMANGQQVHSGAVAMNGVPFGSQWRVRETGAVYVVADRIGHSSQFDIWMASCDAAIQYGRRTITIEKVG